MSGQTVRAAVENVAKLIAENPEKARVKNAPATASLVNGLALSVTGPNGEMVQTDMPKAIGGAGGIPQPGWLLRAALASCTGTVIVMRAAQLGVDVKTLEVIVESESDNRGLLGLDDGISAALAGLRTRVGITAENATRAQIEDIVRWGDAHSPVACTLRKALGSDIELIVS